MVADVLMGVEPHSVFNPREPASLVGCMLVFAGLAVRSWAAGVLKKTRELTTTGPYAVIRNPLYIGSFLIMSGFCTIIGDPANILVALGPIAGLYFLQVRHEERTLSQRYEGRWTEYARRVPRFFPRALPPAPCAAWSVDQWLGNREYRALGAALVGLLAVHAWHLS
jgi:protein-S-isoprenylcysteine O-methyltransferase Ste14